MNEYDSNRILDLTKKINYTLTKNIEVLINKKLVEKKLIKPLYLS